jgi:hypothetical protein
MVSNWNQPPPPQNGGNQPPTPTAQQIQQAQTTYGLHNYDDGQGWLARLLGGNGLNGSGQVDTLDPKTLQSLQQGLYKRSAPPAPAANYLGLSHEQLYHSVQDVDAGQLGGMATSWEIVSTSLIDATQDTAATALASSEAGWTGQNADKARQAIAALTNQAGMTGQAAAVSAQLYQQQATAAQTAKHSVPPPPANPYNPQAAAQQLATITDPFAHATAAANFQQQQQQQNAAHQQAATAVQAYDRTVTQTSENQPGFAPPPVVTNPGGGSNNTGSGTTGTGSGPGGGSTGPTGPVSQPPHFYHVKPISPPPGVAPPVRNPGPPGTQPAPPGKTTLSNYPNGPGGPGLPGNPYGNQGGNSQNNANNYAGGGMFGPMGGGGGGYGSDITRSGSGYGSGGRFGAGGVGSSGSESGTGSRGGIGGAAAEEAAMRGGAAGSRGATGQSGMGGSGGRGGGKKSEDTEHKRASYLLEPDSEGIFGTDEKTVPPVIG